MAEIKANCEYQFKQLRISQEIEKNSPVKTKSWTFRDLCSDKYHDRPEQNHRESKSVENIKWMNEFSTGLQCVTSSEIQESQLRAEFHNAYKKYYRRLDLQKLEVESTLNVDVKYKTPEDGTGEVCALFKENNSVEINILVDSERDDPLVSTIFSRTVVSLPHDIGEDIEIDETTPSKEHPEMTTVIPSSSRRGDFPIVDLNKKHLPGDNERFSNLPSVPEDLVTCNNTACSKSYDNSPSSIESQINIVQREKEIPYECPLSNNDERKEGEKPIVASEITVSLNLENNSGNIDCSNSSQTKKDFQNINLNCCCRNCKECFETSRTEKNYDFRPCLPAWGTNNSQKIDKNIYECSTFSMMEKNEQAACIGHDFSVKQPLTRKTYTIDNSKKQFIKDGMDLIENNCDAKNSTINNCYDTKFLWGEKQNGSEPTLPNKVDTLSNIETISFPTKNQDNIFSRAPKQSINLNLNRNHLDNDESETNIECNGIHQSGLTKMKEKSYPYGYEELPAVTHLKRSCSTDSNKYNFKSITGDRKYINSDSISQSSFEVGFVDGKSQGVQDQLDLPKNTKRFDFNKFSNCDSYNRSLFRHEYKKSKDALRKDLLKAQKDCDSECSTNSTMQQRSGCPSSSEFSYDNKDSLSFKGRIKSLNSSKYKKSSEQCLVGDEISVRNNNNIKNNNGENTVKIDYSREMKIPIVRIFSNESIHENNDKYGLINSNKRNSSYHENNDEIENVYSDDDIPISTRLIHKPEGTITGSRQVKKTHYKISNKNNEKYGLTNSNKKSSCNHGKIESVFFYDDAPAVHKPRENISGLRQHHTVFQQKANCTSNVNETIGGRLELIEKNKVFNRSQGSEDLGNNSDNDPDELSGTSNKEQKKVHKIHFVNKHHCRAKNVSTDQTLVNLQNKNQKDSNKLCLKCGSVQKTGDHFKPRPRISTVSRKYNNECLQIGPTDSYQYDPGEKKSSQFYQNVSGGQEHNKRHCACSTREDLCSGIETDFTDCQHRRRNHKFPRRKEFSYYNLTRPDASLTYRCDDQRFQNEFPRKYRGNCCGEHNSSYSCNCENLIKDRQHCTKMRQNSCLCLVSDSKERFEYEPRYELDCQTDGYLRFCFQPYERMSCNHHFNENMFSRTDRCNNIKKYNLCSWCDSGYKWEMYGKEIDHCRMGGQFNNHIPCCRKVRNNPGNISVCAGDYERRWACTGHQPNRKGLNCEDQREHCNSQCGNNKIHDSIWYFNKEYKKHGYLDEDQCIPNAVPLLHRKRKELNNKNINREFDGGHDNDLSIKKIVSSTQTNCNNEILITDNRNAYFPNRFPTNCHRSETKENSEKRNNRLLRNKEKDLCADNYDDDATQYLGLEPKWNSNDNTKTTKNVVRLEKTAESCRLSSVSENEPNYLREEQWDTNDSETSDDGHTANDKGKHFYRSNGPFYKKIIQEPINIQRTRRRENFSRTEESRNGSFVYGVGEPSFHCEEKRAGDEERSDDHRKQATLPKNRMHNRTHKRRNKRAFNPKRWEMVTDSVGYS